MAPRLPRSLWSARRKESIVAALQAAYSISRHRTLATGYRFRHQTDRGYGIACHSPPGINDTTTAVMCVDYLTAILARLASRNIPASRRYEEGELRVIAHRADL